MNAPPVVGTTLHREITGALSLRADSREVDLSFSSEQPYLRPWGWEILSHDRSAVDLSRLEDSGPLLVDHDRRDVVGVIEVVRIGADRKGRARVRFGRSARAQEVLRDVQDGIRTKTSVAYQIDDMRHEGTAADGEPIFRVVRWSAFEISLTAVPADSSVGVGRSHEGTNNMERRIEHVTRTQRRSAGRDVERQQYAAIPHEDRAAFRRHIRGVEAEDGADFDGDIASEYQSWRQDSIDAIAGQWRDASYGGEIRALADMTLLDDNGTVGSFRKGAMQIIGRNHQPQLDTGRLEADREQPGHQQPGYGRGARVNERYATLQNITGQGAEQRAYNAGMWVKSLVGDQSAARYVQERGWQQQRALGTSTYEGGGALVPTAMENEIINLANTFGVFRRSARVWPMETAGIGIPVKTAGLSVASLPEGSVTPTSDPAFSQINLTAKDVGGATRVHRNLLADSPVALGDFIVGEFGRTIAEREDANGFIGDGTSTYQGMRGILPLMEAGTNAGAVDAASGHDTFAEIDGSDLATLMAALPEYARSGAAWYLSSTARDMIMTRLMLLAGGNNVETLRQGVGESFLGYPVRTSPKMPTTATNGKVFVLFGNLRLSSHFGDRQGLQVDIDTSRFIEYREVYFQVTERFDIVNSHVGTATEAGPVVGLKAKT